MTMASITTLDDVAAGLTDEFETPRVIWQRIDCWDQITVRNVLNRLVEMGRAESKQVHWQRDQYRLLFRRPQGA